jgi:Mg2+ and Co2+ transporter CorA
VLSEELGLHPLAVEAALYPSQRPSIATIALAGLVLYLIFKRKDWL